VQIEAGQVAVVTGAGSGIGRALALHAAGRAMRVVVADVDPVRVDDTVAAIGQLGAEAIGVRTDVSVDAEVQRLADAAFSAFGAVHLLCNNAGVFCGGLLWERTEADWDWVLGVNVRGITSAIRAFVPRMIDAGEPGHIVNTASMGGLVTGAYSGPYYTSKFAAVGLTDCLAHDLRASGTSIGASVLVPSLVHTDIGGSGRHRPERFVDRSHQPGADVEFVEQMLTSASTEAGMPPTEVADLVFDAVEADRFWIPTKPSYHDQIRQRHDDMQDLTLPRPPVLD